MKKIAIILSALLISLACAMAQSSAVKTVSRSVFTLTTFNKDGSIHASSHGVFVGANGEAISTWSPFVGAASAVVVDAKGNKMNVDAMIGANEIYDVCKFRVSGKTTSAPIANTPAAADNKLWLVGYSLKNPEFKEFSVSSVEKFMDKYSYYIFKTDIPENTESCPIVNQKGQVIGLLELSKNTTNVYATDANFINSFLLTGLSINDPVLRQTNIRTAIPDKQQDALLTLILASERPDSAVRVQYINEFINKFPTLPDGYTSRAKDAMNSNHFDIAAADMESAIKNSLKKDEAHSNYAKLIYQKEIYKSDIPYAPWSLDKAMEQAKQAYDINPLPIYQHQQAQIIFSKGDYQNAYNMFIALSKTPIRNGEIFYEAAQCKTQIKAPRTEIIALLDSAIAACPQPLTSMAAPYVLARGSEWETACDYRKAVTDYNQYDSLMNGRPISSQFYYNREQLEIKIHQYKQALNDITRAIIMTPNDPTYWAEKASLHLRVNQFIDAIKSAERCTQLAPEYSDGFIVLGIAQIQNKDKANGLKSLQKAKELGDTRANELINKYK